MRLPLVVLAALPLLGGCPRKDGGGGDDRVHARILTDHGLPADGSVLLHHDGAGELLGIVETAAGEARVEVDDGQMLSALYVFLGDFGLEQLSVHTIADVRRGDDLFFTVTGLAPGDVRANVTLALDGTPFAGADSYGYALAGCGGATGSTSSPSGSETVPVSAQCAGDAFVPWAFARQTGLVVAFRVLAETPLEQLESEGATFTGAWRTDFETVPFALTGFPASSYGFVLDYDTHDDEDRRLAGNGAAANAQGITSSSGSFTIVPLPTAARAVVSTTVLSTNGSLSWLAARPLGAPVDLDFLPLGGYLSSASVSIGSRGVELAWSGTLAGADRLELAAGYGVAENRVLSWVAWLPADSAPPFAFPAWPAAYSADGPPGSADLVDTAIVRFIAGEWDGWDEARTNDPRDDLPVLDRRILSRPAD